MAKLTGSLSDIGTGHIQPTRAVQEASPLSALANIANAGLGLYKQVSDKQESDAKIAEDKAKQERDQGALAGVQTGILDLEDERNSLARDEQDIAVQMQNITQDGVTAEEQVVLDSLEKAKERLSAGKRSGLLNPLNYQTRLNALQKNSLADVNNGAIQGQINSLFSQGRSNLVAPISSAQQAEESYMDKKFGVGNWTGSELGSERGKAIYLNQVNADARNNYNTFTGQEAMSFMNIADDHVLAMRTALNNNGSLSDVDMDRYRAGINSSTQVMLSNIAEAVQLNRQNGIELDPELVKQSKQKVLDNQKFYLDFMGEGQEFGDNVKTSQRLANMNKITAAVNQARNPGFAAFSSLVAGSGTGGDLISLAQLASAPDSLLNSVVANLPDSMRGSVTANSLKEQAAQTVALAIDGVDFKDLANEGLVNRRLAAVVAAIGIKTTDNAKAITSYLTVFEQVDFNDTESTLDLFNQPKTQNNLKNNPKGIQRLSAVAVHLLDNIKAEMRPVEQEALSIQEDGSLQIGSTRDASKRQRGVNSVYTNKLLKKYNAFLNLYAKELKLNKAELYADLLPKKVETGEGSE